MEAAGRPEVLPLGWPVAGGLLEGQTDLAVEEEAHSQNQLPVLLAPTFLAGHILAATWVGAGLPSHWQH